MITFVSLVRRNPLPNLADRGGLDACNKMSENHGRDSAGRGEAMSIQPQTAAGEAEKTVKTHDTSSMAARCWRWCEQVPGLALYGVWCVGFAGVCVGTHYLSQRCQANGLRDNALLQFEGFTEQDQTRIVFVRCLAAAIFGVGTWIQLSALLFQISAKKRQLSSLVAFVNLVSMTTYIAWLCGAISPVYGWNGLPLQMRYVEWLSATPVMLLCLAALGSTMQDELVQDWSLVSYTVFWDVVMVNMGLMHSAVISKEIGWAACACGVFAGCNVFYGVNRLTSQSVKNAATTHEVVSLRALEYFTYLLWAFFPIIHVSYKAGYIDSFQEEIAMAIMDIVAKQIYSVTLLTGNFCIMDVVSTLRLAQIQADRDQKSSEVLSAEIMNRALHTKVVEAETSARLSRLFLANISHELRTPLNSVISFNSLILEDGGMSEVHTDYLQASLTSAEALLGVINQVLEFAKLETQEDDNTLNKVDLEAKPFCLRKVCDELCDIVSSRVNSPSRHCDFAIENSVLFSPNCPHMVVGDGFRLRQCLINLCDNGIKFAKDQGGQVRLRIRLERLLFPPVQGQDDTYMLRGEGNKVASGGDGAAKVAVSTSTLCWQFDVVDNGIGIPMDKQNVLFKPFVQVSSHYARRHGGTGLGLAITKKIVAAMGGVVSLSSRGSGLGATFSILIPAASLQASETLPKSVPDTKTTLRRSGSYENLANLLSQPSTCIHLVLAAGPTCESITALMREFGATCVSKEIVGATSMEDVEHIKKLIEAHASVRACSPRGTPASTVYVLESELAMLLHKHGCTALEKVPVLIIGSQQSNKAAKAMGTWTQSILLSRPVKLSQFTRKCHCLLSSGPLQDAVDDDGKNEMAPVIISAANTPLACIKPTAKLRILVVEDHVVNQKVAVAMVGKILGKDNVEIVIANDGLEALELATKTNAIQFDLILMDVQMPGMDGLEATRRIREWESTIGDSHYIVALTAHTNKTAIDDCLSAGMDRYMSKPFNMPHIKSLLNELKTGQLRKVKCIEPLQHTYGCGCSEC